MSKRERLFVLNDPHAMRISGELAAEIGLNESIVLLQIEFIISVYGKQRRGRQWTRQSLSELRDEYFQWWSLSTVHRAVKNLEDRNLLTVKNHNRTGFDRTQWFALNLDGLATLRSVTLAQDPDALPLNSPISQNEKSISQNDKSIRSNREIDSVNLTNRSSQNEKSLRKETSEETSEERTLAPNSALASGETKAERKARRDGIWDSLSEIFDAKGAKLTRTEQSGRGKVVAELLDVGATGAEVERRARMFTARFPCASVTAFALVKHWNGLQPPKLTVASEQPEPEKCEHGVWKIAHCEDCAAEGVYDQGRAS